MASRRAAFRNNRLVPGAHLSIVVPLDWPGGPGICSDVSAIS
jgi:hypothetical protein